MGKLKTGKVEPSKEWPPAPESQRQNEEEGGYLIPRKNQSEFQIEIPQPEGTWIVETLKAIKERGSSVSITAQGISFGHLPISEINSDRVVLAEIEFTLSHYDFYHYIPISEIQTITEFRDRPTEQE